MNPNQQLFNDAYLGLKSQDFRQSANDFGCMYRHGKLKCAIGHCIPDHLYDPDMDSLTSMSTIVNNQQVQGVIDRLYPDFDLDFAEKLQIVHDMADKGSMQESLITLAEEYGLEVPA